MMNWTDEVVRAEAEYRRTQLHKLAGPRRADGGRRARAWWWHRTARH